MTLPRALAAAVAVVVVAAPAASAAQAPASAPCAPRAFSQIFSAFGDSALYTLAPDGGLEAGGAGWTLGTGAKVVAGSSTIKLDGKLGARSLSLASGATATTPAICVERGYPSFRLAARAATAGASVRVQVIYGADRKVMDAGTIKPGTAWGVSPVLKLVEGLYQVKSGESGVVRFQFTASGGSVAVDDVYLDPMLRR